MKNGDIEAVSRQLLHARELVFFTGAGISVASGIPTFREGVDGLWNAVDPEEVSSIRAFREQPEWVWQWYGQRKAMVDGAKPNAAHQAIAALERRFPDKRISVITQNIDGLHSQAGSRRVTELHGSISRIRCHARCGYTRTWEGNALGARLCPSCGELLRPDIVWFGEALDQKTFSLAEDAALHADLFISIGTSALVQPAARLPLMAKGVGGVFVEVNPNPSPLADKTDHLFNLTATAFFSSLLEHV